MTWKKVDTATSLAFMTYGASVVITPLSLLNMTRELNFSLSEGGGIEAGRTLLLIFTLFASSKAASFAGKARAVGMGLIVISLSLFGAGVSKTYWGVFSMIIVVGIGSGIVEALLNPLINDSHPGNPGKYLNIINAFFSLGVFITVLLSGLLLTLGVSWRTLFIALGSLSIIPALFFLSIKKDPNESGLSIELGSWFRCLKYFDFWLLAVAIFFGAACEAAFTFWSASYIQIHFNALPSAAGFGTALFAGAMFTGRILVGKLTRGHHHDRTLMLFFTLSGIGTALLAYYAQNLWIFSIALFCAGLSVSPFWPTIQAISPDHVQEDPTLLFILLSVAGISGFGAASWIMGIIGDRYSLHSSLLLIPFFFLLLALSLVLLRMRAGRKLVTK